jgi:hypothetical protein
MNRGPDSGRALEGLTERQIANFWKKVEKSDDCWTWKGGQFNNGYGAMRVGKVVVGAHRVSYVIARGSLAANLLIRHKCDNPSCVNPDHLEPGAQVDNMADRHGVMGPRVAKGGSNNNARKTHCKRGHEYTPENTRIDRRGWRSCLTCSRTLWQAEQALKRRRSVPAGQG